MKQRCLVFSFFLSTCLFTSICQPQSWSGIISPSRATDWTNAGLTGAGLPGDVPPDSAWTKCAEIAAYGSSSSYASPSTIQAAITACRPNQYVLLDPGDFYLTGGVSLKNNMVLRGSGANQTRIHVNAAASCNGPKGLVCIMGSNTWGGDCKPEIGGKTYNMWSCPSGDYTVGYQHTANWTGSYGQGSSTITLDNVTGIVPNLTPIVLDECDTGFTGSPGIENCSGQYGEITSASVWPGGGGSGYAVGDTGTIVASCNFGRCYGGNNATYNVTCVSSGAVTAFTITDGGTGYTFSNTNANGSGAPTVATTGSGTGFLVQIVHLTPYDNGSIYRCGITMICSIESDAGTMRPARSQEETVVATAITGTGPYTVTISHPLMHPNWSSLHSPQAYWGNSTITNAGVENLTMDTSAVTASCVVEQTAYNVWVTGVACSTANFFHVYESIVSNSLVSNSYFYWTKNARTESYGIGSDGAVANALYENNIVQGVVDPLNPDGSCAGCVFAYNFAVNDYYSATNYMLPSSAMHAGSTDYILEEGNIGAGIYQDTTHGPHFMDTLFRNYWTGYESNNGTMPLYWTIPAAVGAFSRYNNYLGNVLGTSGYHTVYECIPSSPTQQFCSTDGVIKNPGFVHIWDIGFSRLDRIDYNTTPATKNDPLTVSSLFRYGNYDVVHGSVQWNDSEVPTSDPNFPNSVPVTNVFPSSFYNGVTGSFPSCGTGLSFWQNPTTGACPPYPPIGPDVSNGDIGICTSGTYKWSRALTAAQCAGGSFTGSTNGGYGNSNPAMRCFLNQMGGHPDGTGGMRIFDPAACYAADSSAK